MSLGGLSIARPRRNNTLQKPFTKLLAKLTICGHESCRYPVSARLLDGPPLFEPRAEQMHWERQSPDNRVALRFRRKNVHRTRVCRFERILPYHRDHTEFGFLS